MKKYYQLITVDWSKQQNLDADPKAIQLINITGNLSSVEGSTIFFNIEEAKETVLDVSKGTVKLVWFNFVLIQYKMTKFIALNVKLFNLNLE